MRNYIYTDASAKQAVYLEVEGAGDFEVAQFTASWAANEIPTAAVMLAVGRNARGGAKAAIHGAAGKLKQMQRATVWFAPKGDFARETPWPGGKKKIFVGFFTGFAYRKIAGKIHVVGNLIHWLAALGFSSCLTKIGHVANPAALNAAAVLDSLGTTGGGQGNYVSLLVPTQLSADKVGSDLWAAMKTVFCAMASVPTMPCGPAACGGDGTFGPNDAALEALSKIEGPADACNKGYKWGVALKLETEGVTAVQDSVATAIGNEFIESYASCSFWDKLVGNWCPMFGMAVVPMIDTAAVVGDVPAYSGNFWREIRADDYDSYDLTRELHRPLRAVGVVTGYESLTGGGVTEPGDEFTPIGGCFAEDSVRPGDGTVLYVASPPWLSMLFSSLDYVTYTTGLGSDQPAPTSTTPAKPPDAPQTPDTIGAKANALYTRYAHAVFVNQMLRGQGGAFSGKLRFDIAPLSILKINAVSEKFIGVGQDDLAATIYGCVQRVTVTINAEAGMAGTTFTLSHVRTESENGPARTSVGEHPLFGKSIHGKGKHGSPLSDDYEFSAPREVAPPPRPKP